MKNGLIINEYGSKCWYLDDKRHRTDGPAIEYANGSKVWCVHGQCHRADGPAVERADGTKVWYFADKFLGYDQEGFWALWSRLTPDQQNNVNILQWWAKYT